MDSLMSSYKDDENSVPDEPQSPPGSPNFTKPSDTDDEEDFEEPPVKKQRQISLLPSPLSDLSGPSAAPSPSSPGTSAAAKTASKSSKKSKKKTVSRKGNKKGKNNGAGEAEDMVLITPNQSSLDKKDDAPDAKICLSKVYKADKVELSEDRMSAGSIKGYKMVRATRGVTEGAWYFEIKVVHLGSSGHTRLGWSTEKGDLEAPVGFDENSFGYRDIDGTKVHKAAKEKYGEEGYKEGDVIGFYINLPDGSLFTPKPSRVVSYQGKTWVTVPAPDAKDDPPQVVPGSEICFFKNGQCLGTAFSDLFGGRYFPAASLYTLPNQHNCTVKFNFGPDFEFFPDDFGGRVVPSPMIEVPFHGLDVRVENGSSSWHPTRMCPMLINVEKEEGTKIVDADA